MATENVKISIATRPTLTALWGIVNFQLEILNFASAGYASVLPLSIHVDGKGFVANTNDFPFTYTAGFFSTSPNSGSQGGGNDVTIEGYGFADYINSTSYNQVYIGGIECHVFEANYHTIKCTTGPNKR